jgi:hypothetical protein
MSIQPFLDAITGHKWALLTALILGFFVGLVKQGQLGQALQAKLPKQLIPLYAPIIGSAGAFSVEVIQGTAWKVAVVDAVNLGITGAMIAVFGHQLMIEGLRGGKELVPAKAPPTGPTQGKPADPNATLDPATKPPLSRVRIDAALLPWPRLRWGFVAVLYAGLFVWGIIQLACNPAAIVPVLNAEACVLNGAEQGHTIAQIGVDCALPIEQVIVTLLTKGTSGADGGAAGSKAYAEAQHLKMTLTTPVQDGGK